MNLQFFLRENIHPKQRSHRIRKVFKLSGTENLHVTYH